MRISDWSSDVCSSDLRNIGDIAQRAFEARARQRTPADEGGRHLRDERRGAALALAAQRHRSDIALRRSDGDDAARQILFGNDEGEERDARPVRSEEHTSELQSLMRISYAVFCLKK